MAEYSKIFKKIWNDEDFRTLSDDAKMLWLYLLTCPHVNLIGLFVLPNPYICGDMGWDEKRLGKPFGELLGKGYIKHDANRRIVLIRSWFKYNKIENPNQLKRALAELSEIPSNTPMLVELARSLETLSEGLAKGLLERLPKPEAVAVAVKEAVTEVNTSSPAPDGGGDIDIEKDEPPEKPKKKKRQPLLNREQQSAFDAFYAVYPRRESPGDAEKAWRQVNPDGAMTGDIMAGIARLTEADYKHREKKYIKLPATWLRARCWNDEPTPRQNGNGSKPARPRGQAIEKILPLFEFNADYVFTPEELAKHLTLTDFAPDEIMSALQSLHAQGKIARVENGWKLAAPESSELKF